MSLAHIMRAPRSLRRRLLLHRLREAELSTDRRLGIDTTVRFLRGAPNPAERDAPYDPMSYPALRIVVNRLRLQPDDVVFDLGCGMGRMACYFALQPLRGCVGVEIDPGLADKAALNAVNLKGRRTPIEILRADAGAIDLSRATVLTLFNPFGAEVMRAVLNLVSRGLGDRERPLRILYAHPLHAKVFEEFRQFRQSDRFRIPHHLSDLDVIVWTADQGAQC